MHLIKLVDNNGVEVGNVRKCLRSFNTNDFHLAECELFEISIQTEVSYYNTEFYWHRYLSVNVVHFL